MESNWQVTCMFRMHTNNLGVRVGSLHLYETDVDEQDFALQQGTTSHKIKNFCICFSSNKEVAPSNRRIFRKYLCTDFLLFNIIIALNFKQMCHEVFLCDLDLNKLKTQPWHEIHVIVYTVSKIIWISASKPSMPHLRIQYSSATAVTGSVAQKIHTASK